MKLVISEQCLFCKNGYWRVNGNYACKAFPEGIPEDILNESFDHSYSYPNVEESIDNGIHFELHPNTEKVFKLLIQMRHRLERLLDEKRARSLQLETEKKMEKLLKPVMHEPKLIEEHRQSVSF